MFMEICALSVVLLKTIEVLLKCVEVYNDFDDVEPLTEEMRSKLYS